MDRKKSIINIGVSLFFKLVILVLSLINRRFLILYIGNAVNGINSLFTSILGFLSVAELGVGTAISFSLYKPIVNNDYSKISAIYRLFKKIYLIIGLVILLLGLLIIPFLPYLVADYSNLDIDIYIPYLLALLSTVLTYSYSSKTSLINAYKDNYITTTINSSCIVLRNCIQMVVLFLTKSFVLYCLCSIITTVIEWSLTTIVSKSKYEKTLVKGVRIDLEAKQTITKNVKAMFVHKIGGVLVNTADSIIISSFIGVIVLGYYSNYTTIMNSMVSILNLFFYPLTAIIGQRFVKNSKEKICSDFNFFYGVNVSLAFIFFLGYFAVIDDIIYICFGPNLELSSLVSYIISLNYFIQFLRQSIVLFKDASGNFYHDRYKPILEGVINVILSILFVKVFPEEVAVVGVIVATILTNLFVCHIIEPFVLFKYGFEKSAKTFYLKNYFNIILFSGLMVFIKAINFSFNNHWISLLVNGIVSVSCSLIIITFYVIVNKDFRNGLLRVLKRRRKNNENTSYRS